MIAVTTLIFKTIIGAERSFAVPGLIISEQEGGHEYSIASGNNMHGRVFIDQIAGYDDMIQLIPFSLILVGSGIVQDMGIGKKIVELAGFRISGGFSGRQYLCDAGVFRICSKESHRCLNVRAASKRSASLSFSPP